MEFRVRENFIQDFANVIVLEDNLWVKDKDENKDVNPRCGEWVNGSVDGLME